MAKKRKIAVIVDHDIVIRNFIGNGSFDALMERHDVLFYFPEPGYKNNSRVSIDLANLGLGDRVRHLPVDTERYTIWSKLFHVNRLRWSRGAYARQRRERTYQLIGPGHVREYTALALPGVTQLFEKRSIGRVEKIHFAALERMIDEQKPSLIIHPTVMNGPYINDLILELPKHRIPLMLIMNSWDNMAGQRYLCGVPDRLLVWGEQTLRHSVTLAGIPEDRTVRFGAAQFDIYRKPPRIDRDEFCRRHEVDPQKKILLYAGSAKGTSEITDLRLLDEAIENGELGPAVIIYRPHPWGNGGEGGENILSHPWRHVRIESSMREYLEEVARNDGYATCYPDYWDTRDVLANIDALVSPLSTIILEAALCGKPPMCFLPLEEEADAKHFQAAAPLPHFSEMYKMPEFIIGRRRSELVDRVRDLLAWTEDPIYLERLKKAARFFVETFEHPYGERLADEAEALIDRGH